MVISLLRCCKILPHLVISTFALVFIFGMEETVAATLRPNEVLRITFDIPRPYFDPRDSVADNLRFNLPITKELNLISKRDALFTTKLYDGDRLLGSSATLAKDFPFIPKGASIPAVGFYSRSERWPRYPLNPLRFN